MKNRLLPAWLHRTTYGVILIYLVMLSTAVAGELFIVDGGISPDQKLAIAVVPQKEGEFVDEADGSVYLVQNPGGRVIQKLVELDSTGGTWGKTTENLDCKWNPNSQFVVVNMRTGRMMHRFDLFQIKGSKAIPVKLPAVSTNKKSKIYEALKYTANPGEVFTAWLSPTSFTTEAYGLWPKGDNIDFSQYGIPDFDGLLEKVYLLKKGQWILEDIRSPKTKKDG